MIDANVRLRIAIPSKGRLHEHAVSILRDAGLRFRIDGRRLFAVCSDSDTLVILAHAADVPSLVATGSVDLGITGSDQVAEAQVDADVTEVLALGFGRCRLSVAVQDNGPVRSIQDLDGRVVGTKFINLSAGFFAEAGVDVRLVHLSGATEVMAMLGIVDGIVDIVETGNSLVANDLVELQEIRQAEAVLIGSNTSADSDARATLITRITGVIDASRKSMLEFNCPTSALGRIGEMHSGFTSPTVLETMDPEWHAVRVLVDKADVHPVMDALKAAGCQGILETEVRQTRL